MTQKDTWKQNYTHKIQRVAPELSRSKIRGEQAGVKVRVREAEFKGKVKLNLPSIFLSNVNGLYNKIDEFKALIATNQLKNCCTLVVTETWLTSNHADNQLSLPGYTLLRADRNNRPKSHRVGGIINP